MVVVVDISCDEDGIREMVGLSGGNGLDTWEESGEVLAHANFDIVVPCSEVIY